TEINTCLSGSYSFQINWFNSDLPPKNLGFESLPDLEVFEFEDGCLQSWEKEKKRFLGRIISRSAFFLLSNP
ncbi:MAG: hypothetical protein CL609_11125, partial [Anaerolineaceae bacterium]|nr:hypothetical protein [Anaerolineaceae bacterium]